MTGAPPINMLKRKGASLIVVSQYAGCNGNTYQFYWIDVKNGITLKPVRFMGVPTREKENELYAGVFFESAIRFVDTSRFYERELWVGGYDNAYTGSFLIQFAESSPGQWSCIGFYTQAGGGLQEMEKKLLAK